jgi:Undecaprenyl-phosphate glucose phosphotransferase
MIKDNQKLLNRFHILVDAILIAFSLFCAYQLRFKSPLASIEPFIPQGYYLEDYQYYQMLIFIIPGYLAIYYFCNLYSPKRSRAKHAELWDLFKANAVGIAYFTLVLYFLKVTNAARLLLIIFLLLNTVYDYFFRLILIRILKYFRKKGYNLKHVIIVGYSRAAERYIDRIIMNPEWGYYIHGILDDNKEPGDNYNGIQVLGPIHTLTDILPKNSMDEIAITLSINEYSKLEQIVGMCEKSGVHTKFIPDYNNIIPTRPYTEDLNGLPVINIRKVPLTNTFNKILKRFIDIFGAIVALIVFAIPMIVVSLLIKLTSEGPLIFCQTRIGLHNKEFKMYKFRSMEIQKKDTEKKAWTTINDPRVTPIGKFIRKTSLDELPQIFNVLKGEMSLIGPRPERPFFVEKFKEEIPRYMIKHQVRPGLTGWAQINGYRGDTSIRKRIDCDLYYIENWTLGLDIKILFLTFFKGFVNKNAY